MSRHDRQTAGPTWCRQWPLAFAFLLVVFTAHLLLVVPHAMAASHAAQPMGLGSAEHDPERSMECSIGGSLVSPDRVRLGPFVVDTANADPAPLGDAGSSVAHPVTAAPPLVSASLRAFLQVFLI